MQCESQYFTCANGACIDLENRCDDINDCNDGSDEKDCSILTLDESQYRKSYAPKPSSVNEKLDVSIRLNVQRIDTILELKSSYQIRFMMITKWRDSRINFVNLRSGLTNIVSDETAKTLWIPPLEIPEALTETNLDYDDKSSLLVLRESNGTAAGTEILHEGVQFEGNQNSLMFIKQLQLKHNCMFQLQNYPFDVQLCRMKVILLES